MYTATLTFRIEYIQKKCIFQVFQYTVYRIEASKKHVLQFSGGMKLFFDYESESISEILEPIPLLAAAVDGEYDVFMSVPGSVGDMRILPVPL